MATTFLQEFSDRREVKSTLFGHVYVGKSADGRLVAIKEEARLTRKSKEKKLSNEPEIHAQLQQHANIVSFFRTHEEKANRYIVMEFVPHGSIKEYVERNGHLSLKQSEFSPFISSDFSRSSAQFVFKQLVAALEHIHAQGVLYRNCEPAHVLISHINEQQEMFVKLCDFGASRSIQHDGLMQPTEDFNALAKTLFFLITGYNFVQTDDVYEKLAVFSETAADLIRRLMSNEAFGFEAIKQHAFWTADFTREAGFKKEDLDSSFRVGDRTDDEQEELASLPEEETDDENAPSTPRREEHENRPPSNMQQLNPDDALLWALHEQQRANREAEQPVVRPPAVLQRGPAGDAPMDVLSSDTESSVEAQAGDDALLPSPAASSVDLRSNGHSAIDINESEIRMSPCTTVRSVPVGGDSRAAAKVRNEPKRFFLVNWALQFFRWIFRC
ncbi:Protein kinase domain-containing protein [Aphelenchoides fujianensis]|nr:Protein kinase domain-containing protein [Aphelenchoides fujianensis]